MTIIGYIVVYFWTKHKMGTNYNYNIFDDPEHSAASKLAFRNTHFVIPSKLKDRVKRDSGYAQSKGDHILFEQNRGDLLAILLNTPIGNVSHYKYFEIDVVENPKESNIYIGL
mmetsp:Transcript_18005/g.15930  ORF Transcript_18005/g.15930 Transcript_18005/m.15930 type:complete len:113 (+) Transcript_18005:392-730(+)